eukprot:GILK01006563.1.p1 GENE.GILK01006563.1~~GILK01006563.1.p1  ORF type:complete len:919 (-),score=265.95 GILK01006563.1:230-2986(-)
MWGKLSAVALQQASALKGQLSHIAKEVLAEEDGEPNEAEDEENHREINHSHELHAHISDHSDESELRQRLSKSEAEAEHWKRQYEAESQRVAIIQREEQERLEHVTKQLLLLQGDTGNRENQLEIAMKQLSEQLREAERERDSWRSRFENFGREFPGDQGSKVLELEQQLHAAQDTIRRLEEERSAQVHLSTQGEQDQTRLRLELTQVQGQLQDERTRFQNVTAELQQLQQLQNGHITDRVNQLESELRSMRDVNQQLEADRMDLQSRLANLQMDNAKGASDHEDRFLSVSKQLEQLTVSEAHKEKQLEQLQSALKSAQELIRKIETERDDVTGQLSRQQQEAMRIQKQDQERYDALYKQLQRIQSESSDSSSQDKVELELELHQLRTSLHQAELDLESYRVRYEQALQETATIKRTENERYETVSQQLQQLQQQCEEEKQRSAAAADLKVELDRALQYIQQVDAERQTWSQRFQEEANKFVLIQQQDQARYDAVVEQLQRLQSQDQSQQQGMLMETKAIRENLSRVESERDQWRQKYEQEAQKIAVIRQQDQERYDSIVKQVQRLQAECREFSRKEQETEATIRHIREQVQRTESERDKWRSRYEEEEKKVNSVRQQEQEKHEQTVKQFQRLQNDYRDVCRRVQELEDELRDAQDHIERAEPDQAETRTRYQELVLRLQETTEELEAQKKQVTKYADAEKERERLMLILAMKEEENNRNLLALTNLQSVLEQFQNDQESTVMRFEEDLQSLRNELTEARKAAAECPVLREKANEAEQAASHMKAQLDEMKITFDPIKKERDDIKRALEQALTVVRQSDIEKENLIDRRVISRLLVNYFHTQSNSRTRNEVMQLMANMLSFTEEEKIKVGLIRPARTSMSSWLLGSSSDPTPDPNGKSLGDMWMDFLEREALETKPEE